ncbi:unnamed protein product [Amoebophrya sp. A120]|nr:unnamed protein product [Amoebophrya sp. A120]|eukprot:GSA120T00009890001.1
MHTTKAKGTTTTPSSRSFNLHYRFSWPLLCFFAPAGRFVEFSLGFGGADKRTNQEQHGRQRHEGTSSTAAESSAIEHQGLSTASFGDDQAVHQEAPSNIFFNDGAVSCPEATTSAADGPSTRGTLVSTLNFPSKLCLLAQKPPKQQQRQRKLLSSPMLKGPLDNDVDHASDVDGAPELHASGDGTTATSTLRLLTSSGANMKHEQAPGNGITSSTTSAGHAPGARGALLPPGSTASSTSALLQQQPPSSSQHNNFRDFHNEVLRRLAELKIADEDGENDHEMLNHAQLISSSGSEAESARTSWRSLAVSPTSHQPLNEKKKKLSTHRPLHARSRVRFLSSTSGTIDAASSTSRDTEMMFLTSGVGSTGPPGLQGHHQHQNPGQQQHTLGRSSESCLPSSTGRAGLQKDFASCLQDVEMIPSFASTPKRDEIFPDHAGLAQLHQSRSPMSEVAAVDHTLHGQSQELQATVLHEQTVQELGNNMKEAAAQQAGRAGPSAAVAHIGIEDEQRPGVDNMELKIAMRGLSSDDNYKSSDEISAGTINSDLIPFDIELQSQEQVSRTFSRDASMISEGSGKNLGLAPASSAASEAEHQQGTMSTKAGKQSPLGFDSSTWEKVKDKNVTSATVVEEQRFPCVVPPKVVDEDASTAGTGTRITAPADNVDNAEEQARIEEQDPFSSASQLPGKKISSRRSTSLGGEHQHYYTFENYGNQLPSSNVSSSRSTEAPNTLAHTTPKIGDGVFPGAGSTRPGTPSQSATLIPRKFGGSLVKTVSSGGNLYGGQAAPASEPFTRSTSCGGDTTRNGAGSEFEISRQGSINAMQELASGAAGGTGLLPTFLGNIEERSATNSLQNSSNNVTFQCNLPDAAREMSATPKNNDEPMLGNEDFWGSSISASLDSTPRASRGTSSFSERTRSRLQSDEVEQVLSGSDAAAGGDATSTTAAGANAAGAPAGAATPGPATQLFPPTTAGQLQLLQEEREPPEDTSPPIVSSGDYNIKGGDPDPTSASRSSPATSDARVSNAVVAPQPEVLAGSEDLLPAEDDKDQKLSSTASFLSAEEMEVNALKHVAEIGVRELQKFLGQIGVSVADLTRGMVEELQATDVVDFAEIRPAEEDHAFAQKTWMSNLFPREEQLHYSALNSLQKPAVEKEQEQQIPLNLLSAPSNEVIVKTWRTPATSSVSSSFEEKSSSRNPKFLSLEPRLSSDHDFQGMAVSHPSGFFSTKKKEEMCSVEEYFYAREQSEALFLEDLSRSRSTLLGTGDASSLLADQSVQSSEQPDRASTPELPRDGNKEREEQEDGYFSSSHWLFPSEGKSNKAAVFSKIPTVAEMTQEWLDAEAEKIERLWQGILDHGDGGEQDGDHGHQTRFNANRLEKLFKLDEAYKFSSNTLFQQKYFSTTSGQQQGLHNSLKPQPWKELAEMLATTATSSDELQRQATAGKEATSVTGDEHPAVKKMMSRTSHPPRRHSSILFQDFESQLWWQLAARFAFLRRTYGQVTPQQWKNASKTSDLHRIFPYLKRENDSYLYFSLKKPESADQLIKLSMIDFPVLVRTLRLASTTTGGTRTFAGNRSYSGVDHHNLLSANFFSGLLQRKNGGRQRNVVESSSSSRGAASRVGLAATGPSSSCPRSPLLAPFSLPPAAVSLSKSSLPDVDLGFAAVAGAAVSHELQANDHPFELSYEEDDASTRSQYGTPPASEAAASCYTARSCAPKSVCDVVMEELQHQQPVPVQQLTTWFETSTKSPYLLQILQDFLIFNQEKQYRQSSASASSNNLSWTETGNSWPNVDSFTSPDELYKLIGQYEKSFQKAEQGSSYATAGSTQQQNKLLNFDLRVGSFSSKFDFVGKITAAAGAPRHPGGGLHDGSYATAQEVVPHGKGRLRLGDLGWFVGNFANGKRSGLGLMFTRSKIMIGFYEHNVPTGWHVVVEDFDLNLTGTSDAADDVEAAGDTTTTDSLKFTTQFFKTKASVEDFRPQPTSTSHVVSTSCAPAITATASPQQQLQRPFLSASASRDSATGATSFLRSRSPSPTTSPLLRPSEICRGQQLVPQQQRQHKQGSSFLTASREITVMFQYGRIQVSDGGSRKGSSANKSTSPEELAKLDEEAADLAAGDVTIINPEEEKFDWKLIYTAPSREPERPHFHHADSWENRYTNTQRGDRWYGGFRDDNYDYDHDEWGSSSFPYYDHNNLHAKRMRKANYGRGNNFVKLSLGDSLAKLLQVGAFELNPQLRATRTQDGKMMNGTSSTSGQVENNGDQKLAQAVPPSGQHQPINSSVRHPQGIRRGLLL